MGGMSCSPELTTHMPMPPHNRSEVGLRHENRQRVLAAGGRHRVREPQMGAWRASIPQGATVRLGVLNHRKLVRTEREHVVCGLMVRMCAPVGNTGWVKVSVKDRPHRRSLWGPTGKVEGGQPTRMATFRKIMNGAKKRKTSANPPPKALWDPATQSSRLALVKVGSASQNPPAAAGKRSGGRCSGSGMLWRCSRCIASGLPGGDQANKEPRNAKQTMTERKEHPLLRFHSSAGRQPLPRQAQ